MTERTYDELQLTHDELLEAFDTAELVGSQLDELARATDDVALYRARDHARRAAGCLGAALAALQLHRQPREDSDELLFAVAPYSLPEVPTAARHTAPGGDEVTLLTPTLAAEVRAITDGSNKGPVWQQVDTRTRPTVDEAPPTVELPRVDVDDDAPTAVLPLLTAYGLAGSIESRDLGRC